MAAKTSSEALNYLYQHLITSALMIDAQKPDGKIYKLQRPENSVKEDVVLDVIAMSRGPIQEGVLKLNIWVRNRQFYDPATQTTDHSLPDTERLEYLSRLAEDSLTEVWASDGQYTFTIQQDMILQDINSQHFLHIRIDFFSQTLNN